MDCLSLLSVGVPEVMEYDWEANVKLGLPTGQGFGMSLHGFGFLLQFHSEGELGYLTKRGTGVL